MTSRVQTGRAYYPVVGSSSSSSVGAVPTIQGSSGAAMFANGGYAPSSVHAGTVPIFPNPAPATSSGSRAMLHQMVIQSHPAATSAATSTSMRTAQPSLPARTAAASRHARHVSAGLANNGRYRRARSSYYRLHPLMVEAEVNSLFLPCLNEVELVFVEPETDVAAGREAVHDGPLGLLRIESSSC